MTSDISNITMNNNKKKNSAVKNFKNKISKKKNAINYVTNNMK